MAGKILKGLGGLIGIGGSKKKAADAPATAATATGPIIRQLTGATPAKRKRQSALRDRIMGSDTILRDTLGGN